MQCSHHLPSYEAPPLLHPNYAGGDLVRHSPSWELAGMGPCPRPGFVLKHRQISLRQIWNQTGKFLGNFSPPPRTIIGHSLPFPRPGPLVRRAAANAAYFPSRPFVTHEGLARGSRAVPRTGVGGAGALSRTSTSGPSGMASFGSGESACAVAVNGSTGLPRSRGGAMSAACVARGSGSGGARTGPCIQAYFSEIFARCARRQILNQIWRNPGLGQHICWAKMATLSRRAAQAKRP